MNINLQKLGTQSKVKQFENSQSQKTWISNEQSLGQDNKEAQDNSGYNCKPQTKSAQHFQQVYRPTCKKMLV